MSSSLDHLLDQGGVAVQGCRRKAVWDHTGLTPGCLGEEPKAGKRRLRWFGKEQEGENRGIRGKKGRLYANSVYFSISIPHYLYPNILFTFLTPFAH